ncbi:hypothetical protein [Maricaulis sp. CAU 1757]
MTTQTDSGHEAGGSVARRDALDGVTLAAFDVDMRIFRTMWHSLVHTPRVALAAIQGDFTTYLSPVRVFVALFSFQFLIAALFGMPLTMGLEHLTNDVASDETAAWLAGGLDADGNIPDADAVNTTLENWNSILIWPLTVLASLPFLLLLKLYKPSLPFWAHVQMYLVPSNASYVLLIALMPLALLDLGFLALGLALSLLLYLVVLGRLIGRFYSRTRLGATLRLLGLILLLPVTLAISTAGQFITTHLILENQYGLSMIGLIEANLGDSDEIA